jgi:hypothetical protein
VTVYLRKIVRDKIPSHYATVLRSFEEEGFVFDPHFYLPEPEPAGAGVSSTPLYARAVCSGRDVLVRVEESDEGHLSHHVALVDVSEGGVGRRPVYAVLREAIYEDKFDQAEA